MNEGAGSPVVFDDVGERSLDFFEIRLGPAGEVRRRLRITQDRGQGLRCFSVT